MIHVSSISVSDKYANSLTYEVCEKTKSRGPEGPLDSHSNIFSLFPIFRLKKITLICVCLKAFSVFYFSRDILPLYMAGLEAGSFLRGPKVWERIFARESRLRY